MTIEKQSILKFVNGLIANKNEYKKIETLYLNEFECIIEMNNENLNIGKQYKLMKLIYKNKSEFENSL